MFSDIYDEVYKTAKDKLTAKYIADLEKKLGEIDLSD